MSTCISDEAKAVVQGLVVGKFSSSGSSNLYFTLETYYRLFLH